MLEYQYFGTVKNKCKYLSMELMVEEEALEIPLVCTKMAAFVMAARVLGDISQVERVWVEVA